MPISGPSENKEAKLSPTVGEPAKSRWTWDEVFEVKIQEAFKGTSGDAKYIASAEGKAKIAEAEAATTAALGYTKEEATKDAQEKSILEILERNRRRTAEEAFDTCTMDDIT